VRFAVLLFALFAVVSALVLGDRYISRLPNHDGYWLVHVDDRVAPDAIPSRRPRRVVLVVIDGLRWDQADTMKSAKRLEAKGQCRISDQGDYTVSRPVYSLLSTGLEADRTGSRNNDLTTPLAAESFWEVARRAGLRVRGSSHLPWWHQLFPRGFDEYRHTPNHDVNVFASTSQSEEKEDAGFDVDLFHPLYVDEMGHQHGAASPEYAAAVARADAEIGGLLDRLDLDRDDVILTADHGHTAGGGHGGEQAEIRHVLACFAGPHVRHRTDRRPFDGRLTAPLLSLFAGVAFPANMRAGEDHLDDLWDIAEVEPAFEADRRAAIARFRAENERQLRAWGTDGTWTSLYARERNAQWLRIAIMSVIALAWIGARRRDVLWLAAALGAIWVAHHLVLGDFDYTVINRKAVFVPKALGAAVLAVLAMIGLHRAMTPGARALSSRLLTALVLAMLASAGHVFVYGWPIGFPLPPQPARYLPFFVPFVQLVLGFGYAVAALTARRRA
jgi:hypothetical protein